MFYLNSHGKKAHHWPLPQDLVERMLSAKSPLAELAKLPEADCRERLRAHWAGLAFPANRAIAELILSFPSMCIVEGGDEGFRLALYSKIDVFSITALNHDVPTEQLKFPFASIPGLLEFLTNFSGLMEFGNFVTSASLRIMRNDDVDSIWGPVDLWDGSLVIYELVSCNLLVIRPDGVIGKWDHDFADDISLELHRKRYKKYGLEEGPVDRLKYDFAGLLGKYVEYCQKGAGNERPEEDIFYS